MSFARSTFTFAHAMPTFLTVLRSGGRYTPLWVAALARAVRQHASAFDRFLVLSDVAFALPGVERLPLRRAWPGWWSKMEAFRPGLADDVTVMCDLDTIITAPVDVLARPGLATMEDAFHGGRVSTALMRWRGDELADIYRAFAADPMRWMEPGACGPVPNAVHGDQVVIDHLLRRTGRRPAFFQRAYPGLVEPWDPARPPAPVTFFIGETKPVMDADGTLRSPPMEEAA